MSCPKEDGFAAGSVVVVLAALSLATMYTISSNKSVNDAIKIAKRAELANMANSSNLSSLAIMRSLVGTSNLGSGVYEPAIYPSNYFASSWNLIVNTNKPAPVVATSKSLMFSSFFVGDLSIPAATDIFTGTKPLLSTDPTANSEIVEVAALNHDSLNPYYIRSIDVLATSANQGGQKVASLGRIDLIAPQPGTFKLEIKPESGGAFTSNFGTAIAPLPPTTYILRVVASGIVHHAVLMNDSGWQQILGLTNNQVSHGANNLRAVNEPIGESDPIELGSVTTSSTTVTVNNTTAGGSQTVSQTSCSAFVVTPAAALPSTTTATTTSTSAGPVATVKYSASVFGVDGSESTTPIEQLIYITQKTVTTTTTNTVTTPTGSPQAPGLACTQQCPTLTTDALAPANYFHFLDVSFAGSADKSTLDTFEPAQSALVAAGGGSGIVCANNELVAQGLTSDLGISKPSDVVSLGKWAEYDANITANKEFERYYAYMAPSCQRQLIGTRNGCGCFEENSLILMGDGTKRRVAEVRTGDLIWNPKTAHSQRVKRVIAGPEKVPLIELQIGGRRISVTSQHPFLTTEGLKAAKDLKIEDRVLDGNQTMAVEAVELENRSEGATEPVVWNFELDGSDQDDDHYVMANGVMTGDLFLQEKLDTKLKQTSQGIQ